MSIWMSQALTLAKSGQYTTSPNPMVGCVIIKENQLISAVAHHCAGSDHAEVIALHQAGDAARGGEMYVTLEPCSHHGRTPPCVEKIIQSGIQRVFIAMKDPNPKVNGEGIRQLKAAEIDVHVGLMAEEAYTLNKPFFHYITHNQPFVTAKWAMSLDGKIATLTGESKWITGDLARQSAHALRATVDAILIGKRTALLDNPRLTVRKVPPNSLYHSVDDIRQPRPIILTTTGDIPLTHQLMQPGQRTLVYTSNKASSQWLQALKARQIETEILKTHHGYFAIQEILQSLGKRQIAHLLVEGGNQVLGQFLEQKSINRVHAYLAPKILGSNGLSPLDTQTSLHLSDCPPLHNRTVSDVGEDILISCETLQTPRDYQEFLTSQRNTSHV